MADNNNRNIRLVKAGGRRVMSSTTEYDWNSLDRRPNESKHNFTKETRPETKLQRRVNYQKRQKQRRLKMQRIRAAVILILVIVTITVIMFMTPLFNIRTVTVDGNNTVGEEEFQEMLKPLIGENLFRTGEAKIRKILKTNPYINEVSVQKKIIPPTVSVAVTEYVPAAVLRMEGKNLLVNSSLRILSDNADTFTGIPAVTGISIKEGKAGEDAQSDEQEKKDIVITALRTLEKTDVLGKVIEIDVSDITDITLNYDNRLTIKCGTQLELERKLRLFRETVTNEYFTENDHGTIEFLESGKAEYIP